MVRDLAFPGELLLAPFVREPDGLALSSRNQYLPADQRATAPTIQRTLLAMRDAAQAGSARAAVEAQAREALEAAGYAVDYAGVRDRNLHEHEDVPGGRVDLVAARLGGTRMSSNIADRQTVV